MSINRVNFGEGRWVQASDSLDKFMAKLIIDESLEMLEPGEYDLTPDSWRGVFHTMLHVKDDDKAMLVGDPQCEEVGIEPFVTTIPDQETLTMFMAHSPDGATTRLFGAVFYLPESAYE